MEPNMEVNRYTVDIPALDPLTNNPNLDIPAGPIVADTPLNVDDLFAAETQLTRRKNLHKCEQVTVEELYAAKRRRLQIAMEHAADGAVAPAWTHQVRADIATMMAGLQALSQAVNDPNTGLQALSQAVNDPNTGLQALSRARDEDRAILQALSRARNEDRAMLQALSRARDEDRAMLQALSRARNEDRAMLQELSRARDEDRAMLQALSRNVNEQHATLQALVNMVAAHDSTLKDIDVTLKEERCRNINRSCIRTYKDNIYPIYHPDGLPHWMPQTVNDVLYCNDHDADIYLAFYQIQMPPDSTIEVKRIRIKNHIGITL